MCPLGRLILSGPSRRKPQKEQFGVSKEQKVPKGYAIRFNDGKNSYAKNDDWKPGTYYVTKGYSILQTNFESRGRLP